MPNTLTEEGVLPVEGFMDELRIEQLEERFEFAAWLGSGSAKAQCDTAQAGEEACRAQASVEAQSNGEWNPVE